MTRGDDIHGFLHAGGIVPVANDVGAGGFGVDPTVPHDLMGIETVLGYAHGIDHAAAAVVLGTPAVGLRVGEDDFHAARVDPASGAGAFAPHIVPAAHKLHGQHILVLVVGRGVLPFIERPVALFVIGIAEFVPVFAQPFVAAIFGLYHGVVFALVDVEHLTAVFGFAHVEHLARTDGPSAMRVILVANGNHFEHVFTADGLVAAFVEDDTRIVAVVDDGVAHHLLALFPAAAVDIFFGITGREHLHETYSVA